MGRTLAALGRGLLALLAAAGLLLSAGWLLISSGIGRGLLVPRLVELVNGEIAGRLSLESFALGKGGGLELTGLRLEDPEGALVAEVARVQASVDLSRLRQRRISLRAEVEAPRLALVRDGAGRVNLLRALEPRHPSASPASGASVWTVRVARLSVRGGEVTWRDGAAPPMRAETLDLEARGVAGPRATRVDARLAGRLRAPEDAPLRIEVRAGFVDGRLAVPALRVVVGHTALEAVAEGEPAEGRGRVALLSLAVAGDDVRGFVPAAGLADLTGEAYVESDGRTVSTALEVRPAGDGKGGSASAAGAARLPPEERALGFHLRLDGLDPARVLAALPSGELRLAALGRVAGADLHSLRGSLRASLLPSRLRTGRLGPAEVQARAQAGLVEVSRLEVSLPGGALHGSGTWRPRGAVTGTFLGEVTSLEQLGQNLSALLGRPLPALRGSLRLEVGLTGTAAAPQATVRASAATLALDGVSAGGLALDAEVAGPAAAPRVRLDATLARLSAGGLEARALSARARLEGLEAEASVEGTVLEAGPEPFLFRTRGTLAPDRRSLVLSSATLGWPGTRFELASPARVTFEGPRVDRLELRSGPQRLWAEGGWGREVDLRAGCEALDLSRLPPQLFPEGTGLGGALSARVELSGARTAPSARARLSLAGGAARGLGGIEATGELRWDGPARRASGSLSARGLAGAEVEASADLPGDPGRARSSEPLQARLFVKGLILVDALRAARVEAPVEGTLSLSAQVGGTAGAPTLTATAALSQGRLGDFAPVGLALSLDDPGRRLRVTLAADHAGARAAEVEAEAPLDLADLLRGPARALRALREAPLEARVAVPGLELASVAGKGGLPEGLAGRLSGRADLRGTLGAPRGEVTFGVTGAAAAGFKDLLLSGTVTAVGGELRIEARGGAGGQELATLSAVVGVTPERLGDGDALDRAPLRAEATFRAVDLARLPAPVPLVGAAEGRVTLAGRLTAPELAFEASGKGVGLGERAAGDFSASGSARGRALSAEITFTPAGGGRLHATLTAEAELSRALGTEALLRAPARASLVAEQADLAFLAALAPGTVRSASGHLDARLEAAGPLGALRPRGTARIEGGALNVVGFGDWSGLALDATVTDDAVLVPRLEARRGRGRLSAKAEVRGLSRPGVPGDLSGEVHTSDLALMAQGQELLTLDLDAAVTGTVDASRLDAEVTVSGKRARIPRRTPRALQSLEPRADVVVGKPRPVVPSTGGKPYRVAVRVRVPGNFRVTGEQPRVDVGLRGDVTLVREGGAVTADGRVESTGGSFEDYSRPFQLQRAVVTFGGGPAIEGLVDAEAVYDNPVARVTIAVTGPLVAPAVRMTSEPPLDEGQIAMLIVTGRTEVKAGAGGIGDFGGGEAGSALLGTLAVKALRDTMRDKLPLDTVNIDSGQLRMGKYLSDKVYVGYTRRFNARQEQGENSDELRLEYQMTPRWTLETRYGNANTGSASIIWSKDY
jgi:translocation and assembly module TamB